ncbi:MAG: HAD family hydrolase [Candidatus Bathyarchaeia archaeon]
MIRVVSFDLEGTLVDMTFSDLVWNEGLPRLYALKAGLGFDEAKRVVLGEYARIGEDRVEWYDISYWFRRFDLPGDPQRLVASYRSYVRVYPDAVEALGELSRKYRLIMITNSNRLFVDILAQPIIHYFDRVFSTTSEFGLLKRNPETYRKVCEVMGVAPFEIVHVGDRLHDDFESPRSVGISAYLLDRQDVYRCVSSQCRVRDLREFARRLI